MMLSFLVITKNEESRIRACLESVKWADELIVVDNGSKDDTLKKAREYTDQIFEVDLQDFAEIRNFAMGKAKGEWVLYVDADERVLEPLVRSPGCCLRRRPSQIDEGLAKFALHITVECLHQLEPHFAHRRALDNC